MASPMDRRKRRRATYPPTNERFVEVWQSSSSVREIARKLGLSLQACYQRAGRLKSYGVKLKNFGHHTGPNARRLNRIAKEALKET